MSKTIRDLTILFGILFVVWTQRPQGPRDPIKDWH